MATGEAGTTSKIVRSLRGGQITIPIEFRRSLGIDGDTMLRVSLVGDELRIAPVREGAKGPNASWLMELYELFAPVREDIAASGMTEDEINRAIDELIEEVRAEKTALRT